MERLGVYPGDRTPEELRKEVLENVTDSFGRIRVNKEKCSTCPFITTSWFNYQLKRIIRDLRSGPEPIMQCHSTYPSDVLGAVCRGGYDSIIKDRIKNPTFIGKQRSNYLVSPFGE